MRTAKHNQTKVICDVYEGESPIALENNLLGTFTLYDIPPAPKEIDQMVEEANKYKAEDEEHKKAVAAKLALKNYAESKWDMVDVCWNKFREEDANKMKDAIEMTIQWLDWNFNLARVSEYNEKLNELKTILDPIIGDIP
ncbi:heat shock cognate 70 kDa protein 2-like [Chenopodium quinoa]|uniref:heat shock cognate 70 kDa protein 2-like n=1 Tax=Chenopodium quinoa TaxID=63459 RepID=UPI000B78D2D4|nr:heat shock cognate 70 kDa protein 2-like [Chenopodium quinoa]